MRMSVSQDFVKSPCASGALAVASLLSLSLSSARADVTLIAQQETATGQALPLTQAVKLFYKGSNARLEVAGKPILLYTGKSSLINGLDPVHKTYYMTVTTETEPTDMMPAGPGSSVKEELKLDLTPTNQTRTLAGQSAHQYMLSGAITFTRSRSAGGRSGGGGRHRRGGGGGSFPGGGGFPMLSGFVPGDAAITVDQNSGGYNGGGNGAYGGSLPQWNISGDLWLSDTLTFPDKENTSLAAHLVAVSAGPFGAPLADALAKHKGLPLLARITVIRTLPSADGKAVNQYGGVVEGGAAAHPISTVTTWTVQSLTAAPLADTLFQAPVDYTLVAAPQTPYDPGVSPDDTAPPHL